jgi:threonyl-tRNA synthetase
MRVTPGKSAAYRSLLVVGDEEVKGRQVNVRWRDDTSAQDRGKPIALAEAIEKIRKLKEDRGSYNPFPSIVKPAGKEAAKESAA